MVILKGNNIYELLAKVWQYDVPGRQAYKQMTISESK